MRSIWLHAGSFEESAGMNEMIFSSWYILHVGGVLGHESIVVAFRFVLCSDFFTEVQALPTIPLVHSERLEYLRRCLEQPHGCVAR